MNTSTSWRGVLTPLVTPFEVDGALDLNALVANLEWLFARGANASNTVLLAPASVVTLLQWTSPSGSR